MLTPKEIEEYQRAKDREKEIEKIAGGCVCAMCGSGLRAPWDPTTGQIELRCSRDKSHAGHVWPDRELDRLYGMRESLVAAGKDTTIIDRELQHLLAGRNSKKGAKQMNESTALQEYREAGYSITEERALAVIGATKAFRDAPPLVRQEAAAVCSEYGLFPGIHVYLVEYKGSKGSSWAVTLGIDADRMSVVHLGPQFMDGPRMMTEEEERSIYGDIDKASWRSIVRIRSAKTGAEVVGYGVWKKAETPFGADKGNSGQNMSFIRGERQALRKLGGRKLPNLQIVDDQYVEMNGVVAEKATGEIIEGEAVEVNGTVATETPTEKETFVQPKDDPSEYTPRDFNDLCGACKHYYDKEAHEVEAACIELTGKKPSTKKEIADCWVALVGSWEDAKGKAALAEDGKQIPF